VELTVSLTLWGLGVQTERFTGTQACSTPNLWAHYLRTT